MGFEARMAGSVMDAGAELHLIEPRCDGHRMQYVRRLIEAAPAHWRIVLSTFPSALGHPATEAVLAAGAARLRVEAIAGEAALDQSLKGGDGLRSQAAYWRLLHRHWQDLPLAQRGCHVVLPYLDYISYAIGAFGSPFGGTPFSGIVMRPNFHWAEQGVVAPVPRQRWLKRALLLRLLRHPRLKCLLTIDPSLRDWVQARRPEGHDRLRYADDPADLQGQGGRVEARQHFGLRPDAQVLLLFGAIDMRKGIRQLLQLADDTACPPALRVLLVGRQSAEVRALVAACASQLPDGRLVVVDRYVSRQEEWLSFAAADLAWLAYDGFYGPSGVLAQCRQVGLPVVHRGEGLIGYQLRTASSLEQAVWCGGDLICSRPGEIARADGGLHQVFAA